MNEKFFKRAIELATKGEGFVSPNPCVGAVIVRGGRVVGEGWHRKFGGAHAEVEALRDAGSGAAVGVDMYVTLEPCCHHGKTGPCCEAIVEAGIEKVFVGMKDPFEKVCGRGIRYLRKHGVEVQVLPARSELARKMRELNQPFLKFCKTGLPYVTLKAGMSLDGKIATSGGESKWITGEAARKDARIERSKCDAVVVGAGTVAADDPELAACGKWRRKKLLRVVIDGRLQLDPRKYRVFRDENVVVACSGSASESARRRFADAGVEVCKFGTKRVSVERLLKYLGERGVRHLFVEGGSEVHGSFYDAFLKGGKCVDRVLFYVAPRIIGGSEALPVVGGEGVRKLEEAFALKDFDVAKVGIDLRVCGRYVRW